MEGENTASSHPVLPTGFVSCTFASSFPGIGSQPGNVSNPLLVSTLHHLQGLSAAGGAALLPNSSTLAINGQFANEFGAIANMGWPSQNPGAVWLEQAKVAAMLPVYGVLSASAMKSSETADLNAVSPTKQPESGKNHSASIAPSFALTSNSGIFPLNPVGLVGVARDSKSQQPSPLGYQEIQPKDTSPAESIHTSDARPSSIQSHCTGDLRPCSSSALSSQGPSSVSVRSSSGSVEPVILQADPLPVTPSYVQTDIVSLKPIPNQDSTAYCLASLPGVPFSAVNEPSTSGIDSGAQLSSSQPVYVFSTEEQALRNEALPNGHIEDGTPSASAGDTQDYQFPTLERTPGSVHDNVLDAGNLDDLPWSSIYLGDIDLFNGASAADKDVMHSVLDMDASAMHPIFGGEPSTSEATVDATKGPTPPPTSSLSSAQFNTPKFREKIKMRREKELADADKEFDRLLSLVAKKDAKPEPAPRLPPSLTGLDSVLFAKPGTSSEKISLSPVQFTPPDSPTPSTSAVLGPGAGGTFFFPTTLTPSTPSTSGALASPNKAKPSSSVAPLVFMPNIEKKNKANKVPVYKQKAKVLGCSDVKLEEGIRHVADDAYSFTDDELDDKPLPSGATLTDSQVKEHRLEAEVAQKLARINAHHKKGGTSDHQNQQDLWKHVVPKKRHSVSISDRSTVPSTPLLPPPSTSDTRQDLAPSGAGSSEIMSLSEILRRRMQHRSSYGFLRRKFLDDKDTASEKESTKSSIPELKSEFSAESRTENNPPSNCPPLPRLLLRIPRRSIEMPSPILEKTKKKKKKKKKKDRDRDWEGCEKKKHKKKHKHKHKKTDQIYEVVTVEGNQWCQNENVNRPAETAVYSKKQRLMQWAETEENYSGLLGEEFASQHRRSSFGNYETNDPQFDVAGWNAPASFSQTDGAVAKGTFVVSKADVLKDACPLWRVDSQNLLQKYVPIKCDGRILYKSISTYSGWCDQISDGYLVVKVQFIKHSRSETIVEPEVPLSDMFPAVSFEIYGDNSQRLADFNLSERNSKSLETAEASFVNDPLGSSLVTYIKALLHHAVDLNFLQSIRLKNDWSYLRALNEIEKVNTEKKEKVRSVVRWTDKYITLLQFYSSCAFCDSEGSGLLCQACGVNLVEKVIQLFSNEGYNYDTLESEELRCIGAGSPMPATEYLVCSNCARSSLIYHKLHHMRYLVLKKCEDQMELISSEDPSISPKKVIEKCLKTSSWLNGILLDYLETWKKIDQENC